MKYFIVLVALASYSSYAEEYLWKDECDLNQGAMNDCSSEEYAFNDKQLNIAYKEKMQQLSPEQKKKLRKEQRAWLKNRDSDCERSANNEASGGSMWPLSYNTCLADATSLRTQEIKTWQSP